MLSQFFTHTINSLVSFSGKVPAVLLLCRRGNAHRAQFVLELHHEHEKLELMIGGTAWKLPFLLPHVTMH